MKAQRIYTRQAGTAHELGLMGPCGIRKETAKEQTLTLIVCSGLIFRRPNICDMNVLVQKKTSGVISVATVGSSMAEALAYGYRVKRPVTREQCTIEVLSVAYSDNIAKNFKTCVWRGKKIKKNLASVLLDGESNPGLPRDKRKS